MRTELSAGSKAGDDQRCKLKQIYLHGGSFHFCLRIRQATLGPWQLSAAYRLLRERWDRQFKPSKDSSNALRFGQRLKFGVRELDWVLDQTANL